MTRMAVGVAAFVAAVFAGPRCWLAAGPFALLFSATLCLQLLARLLLSRPRRFGSFVVASLAPLVSFPLAFFWLWTEVLRALPESPQRLGQATLITLALGPGFAGLTAAALWLGQRRRASAGAGRGGLWV
jgi:hypothetical protein